MTPAARDAATLLDGLADLPALDRAAAHQRLVESLQASVTAFRARADRAEKVLDAVIEALLSAEPGTRYSEQPE